MYNFLRILHPFANALNSFCNLFIGDCDVQIDGDRIGGGWVINELATTA